MSLDAPGVEVGNIYIVVVLVVLTRLETEGRAIFGVKYGIKFEYVGPVLVRRL